MLTPQTQSPSALITVPHKACYPWKTSGHCLIEQEREALMELEAEARGCYSEPINLTTKEFIEMILFDGFFIIELFRKNSNFVPIDDYDPISYSSSRRARVVRDLVLLENQIPISVLQRLFDLSKDPNHDSLPLIKMALFFFHDLIPQAMHKCPQNNKSIRGNHLLDLLSYTLESSLSTIKMQGLSTGLESLPSMTELQCSGVKFKKHLTYGYGSLIDIKFNEGVFEIPQLCVNGYTDSFFRNLIVHEQYRIGGTHYITSYAMLMDYLINSTDYVAYLRDRGIIINQIGDDIKVSSLFSNLYSEISINAKDFYYSDLCEKVHEYYNKHSNKWKATLNRDYCNSPWKIISVVVAIVLLFLTVSSTVFAALRFFNVHA